MLDSNKREERKENKTGRMRLFKIICKKILTGKWVDRRDSW